MVRFANNNYKFNNEYMFRWGGAAINRKSESYGFLLGY